VRTRLLSGLAVMIATVGLAVPLAARGSSAYPVWVKVSVATLWTSPSAPRPMDDPALAAPAHIRRWLHDMSTADRRGLHGRVETQALYGERLRVIGASGHWLRVEAVRQPSHRDAYGYPGWVPARQTTTTAPLSASSVATVTALTGWLRAADGTPRVEVSLGTTLPVLTRSAHTVTVASPTHHALTVAASKVVVHARGSAARPLTRKGVLATAREFLGVGYLWGGRSGFAVDCSGFTELVLGVHGRVIPRDADDQATAGHSASASSPRRADLLFFDEGGTTISHVGFAVGSSRMLHAPHTGSSVQVSDRGSPTVARRFVPLR
jgi:cell wall-associated NlpC family hydrolase